MGKSVRFLLRSTWVNLACLLGVAAVVVAGACLTGVAHGKENIFSTYFGSFPLVSLLMLFFFSLSLCTSTLNLALSFGARRRDFFRSLQVLFLVNAALAWGIQLTMSAIPRVLHWTENHRWAIMPSLGRWWWTFPLIALSLMGLGCLCGLVMARSRVWGTVLNVVAMLVAMLVAMACLVLLMITADIQRIWLWGNLPAILIVGVAAVFVLCQVFIRRTVYRTVVK